MRRQFRAAYLTGLASDQWSAGDWVKCEKYARRAVVQWTKLGKLRSVSGSKAVALLAASLLRLQELAERQALLEPFVNGLGDLPETVRTLQVAKSFREDLINTEQFAEAIGVSDIVEHLVAALFGESSLEYAMELDHRAYLLGKVGRNREASELLDRVRPLVAETAGPESREMYRLLKRSGTVAYFERDDDRACRFLEGALAIRTRYGYEDEHAHWWLANLAVSLERLERHAAAAEIFPDAVQRLREEFGDTARIYLIPLSYFALCLAALGDLSNAIMLEESCIAGWRAVGDDEQIRLAQIALEELTRSVEDD